jgi:DNA polymerase-3 subunit alpha
VVELIAKETGEEIELSELPLDDPETYALLHRGETEGVFQLASQGMRNLLTRLKPDNIEEIIALVALYRPGPLGSGMVDKYIRCKHGKEPVSYLHDALEPHLKPTYGLIVYQEQIMQLAHDIGGLSMGEALTMIKAISKKKEKVIKARREAFINGSMQRGLDEKTAVAIYDLIENFAGYGFNKAHASAYAYLTYRMAYLRAHYPVQFFAASMTCEQSNRDQVIAFVKDAKAHGIDILPPSISTSYADFRAEGGQIRYGMAAIKGVGEKAVDAIAAEREAEGPFESLFDFCERVDLRACNRGAIEALIRCGAFDEVEGTRAQLLAALEPALQMAATAQRDKANGQMGLFDAVEEPEDIVEQALPDVPDAPETERLNWEKDLLGFYVSGHPLARYEDLLDMYATATTAELSEKEDGEEVVVGGVIDSVKVAVTRKGRNEGQRWARYEITDLQGTAGGVCFAEEFAQYNRYLEKGGIVFVRARVDFQGNDPSLRAQQLVPIEHAHAALAGGLVVDLEESDADAATVTRLRDLCASHHGEFPVHLRIHTEDDGTFWIRAGRAMYIEPSDRLLDAATGLVGDGKARFTRRKTNGNGNGTGNGRRRRRRATAREG